MDQPDPDQEMTIKEIITEYGIPQRTVYAWWESGRLKACREGHKGSGKVANRFRRRDVEPLVLQWAEEIVAKGDLARELIRKIRGGRE